MSGDAWTLPALKEYVDQRFAANEQAVEKAVAATELAVDKTFAQNQRAIDKAEQDVDRRLEGMNEFRDQLTAERGEYITNATYTSRHDAMSAQIAQLESQLANRIALVERWQNKIVGGLALLALFIPVIAGLTVWIANLH